MPSLFLSRRRQWAAFAAPLAFAALAGTTGCDHVRMASRVAGSCMSGEAAAPRHDAPVGRDARIGVSWVGHATTVLQMDDRVILTDPVFTHSIGQFACRSVAPGVDPGALPSIDLVLLSHVHVDHLSLGSLEQVAPKVHQLVAPAGGLTYLTDFDFDADDLAPWESAEYHGLRVTAVPVDHDGGRYGIDAGWAHAKTAYVLEYHGLVVYFGGDSAFRPDFARAVHARFPAIDVALLPISPNEPRALLGPHHMSTDEAVQTFLALGARTMVPIHYDTITQSIDQPGDALRGLRASVERRQVAGDRVAVLAIGERRVIVGKGGPAGTATVATLR